jgi:hypothetical protein
MKYAALALVVLSVGCSTIREELPTTASIRTTAQQLRRGADSRGRRAGTGAGSDDRAADEPDDADAHHAGSDDSHDAERRWRWRRRERWRWQRRRRRARRVRPRP